MNDDVSRILKNIYGDTLNYGFYCSTKVSWKLAKAIDWLRGAVIEAMTRPDPRIFYMLLVYHELLSIMAVCHNELREAIDGKTPYVLLYDPKVVEIIEKLKR